MKGDSRKDRLASERRTLSMAEPIKFDNPPVVELVFGTLFKTPVPIKSAHVGRYWQKVLKDFPTLEDAAPLDQVVEGKAGELSVSLGISSLPPLRRTWLISDDGRRLIQIQEDRFLFNWKREGFEVEYPSYDKVIQEFEAQLATFVDFLISVGIGEPVFRQFELTYVNHLTKASGLAEVTEGGALIDHTRDSVGSRFLPEPEAINWRTVHPMPNNWGRLHVIATNANLLSTGEKIMRLDLTARGAPDDPSKERREWFDLGHEWITHGFADITSERLHKFWSRTS